MRERFLERDNIIPDTEGFMDHPEHGPFAFREDLERSAVLGNGVGIVAFVYIEKPAIDFVDAVEFGAGVDGSLVDLDGEVVIALHVAEGSGEREEEVGIDGAFALDDFFEEFGEFVPFLPLFVELGEQTEALRGFVIALNGQLIHFARLGGRVVAAKAVIDDGGEMAGGAGGGLGVGEEEFGVAGIPLLGVVGEEINEEALGLFVGRCGGGHGAKNGEAFCGAVEIEIKFSDEAAQVGIFGVESEGFLVNLEGLGVGAPVGHELSRDEAKEIGLGDVTLDHLDVEFHGLGVFASHGEIEMSEALSEFVDEGVAERVTDAAGEVVGGNGEEPVGNTQSLGGDVGFHELVAVGAVALDHVEKQGEVIGCAFGLAAEDEDGFLVGGFVCERAGGEGFEPAGVVGESGVGGAPELEGIDLLLFECVEEIVEDGVGLIAIGAGSGFGAGAAAMINGVPNCLGALGRIREIAPMKRNEPPDPVFDSHRAGALLTSESPEIQVRPW
jgi:hypothetical protein